MWRRFLGFLKKFKKEDLSIVYEVLYHKNACKMYEGEMKGAQFHGQGKCYDESEELLYEGEFAHDLPHGTGTYYFSTDEYYVGPI